MAIIDLINNIKALISSIRARLEEILNSVRDKFDEVKNTVGMALSNFRTALTAWVANEFRRIRQMWRDSISNMKGSILSAVSNIRTWINQAVQPIKDAVASIAAGLTTIMEGIKGKVQSIINTLTVLWDWMKTHLIDAIKDIPRLLAEGIDRIVAFVTDTRDAILESLSTAGKQIQRWLQDLGGQIVDHFATLRRWLQAQVSSIIEGIRQIGRDLVNRLKTSVATLIAAGKARLTQVKDHISRKFTEFKAWFSNIIEDAIRFLQDLWMEIREWFESLITFEPGDLVEPFLKVIKAQQMASEQIMREMRPG